MWAKFGQMAGKAISKIKKPKGLKAKAMGMVQGAKSKVKGYGVKAKGLASKSMDKYKGLSTLEKTGVVGTGLALGIGIPVKAAAFYYGAKAGAKLTGDKKNKKKEYKTTNLDLGKYNYKITSYK